jgi:mortality factor 4-like protein 1
MSDPMSESSAAVEELAYRGSSPPIFRIGQRIQVSENDSQNYPAVIRQIRMGPVSNGWEYLIHFSGWKASWDTWKDETALSDATGVHVLPVAVSSPLSSKKRKAGSPLRPSKRRMGSTAKLVDCELPLTLKTVLVEEWEHIHDKNELHDLPSSLPISKALRQLEKTHPETHDFCTDLTNLFETVLPLCLLYPSERQQYEQLIQDTEKKLTDTYGCEHLLRLLCRLPQLLPNSSYWTKVEELIKLLQKNRRVCFPGNYSRNPIEKGGINDKRL